MALDTTVTGDGGSGAIESQQSTVVAPVVTENPVETGTGVGTAFSDALKAKSTQSTETVPAPALAGGTPTPNITGSEKPAAPAKPAQPTAPAQTTPATPAAPTQQPGQPAGNTDLAALRSAASRLGVQVDNAASADQVAVETMRKLHDLQPMLNYAQQLLPYADKIQQFLAGNANNTGNTGNAAAGPGNTGQGQPGGQPGMSPSDWSPDSHFSQVWGGKEWDESFNRAIDSGTVERDEATGLWKPTQGYEIMAGQIVGQMNEAQTHINGFWSDMGRSNPYKKIYDGLKDPVERLIEDRINKALESQRVSQQQLSTADSFEQANSAWMFQQDMVTGQRVLTQDGQRFCDEFDTLKSKMKDGTPISEIIELATLRTGLGKPLSSGNPASQANHANPASQQPVQAAPVQAAQQQPVPVQQSQPQPSFLESAIRRASHSPSGNGNGSATGAAPEEVTEVDLNNLFRRAVASR
jgi:hypothetical protein